jgi:hypothetical protein
MNIEFLTIAQKELDDAVAYYNYEQEGLGDRFLAEVVRAIKRIERFPQAWQLLTKNSHRCLINHFPYGIIYQFRKDKILIIAIANLHRKPDYWQSRTD